MKPPFPWGRLVAGAVWTAVSAGVAWTWASIVTLENARLEYCLALMKDDPPCWPTWAEDPGANVERWAWGVGVFVFFTTPVWLSIVVWLRQRRRPAERP